MTMPVLDLRDLVKCYGAVAATDHLDLCIQGGEIHAIIGPNGAGKTTLIHQISGAIAPDSGNVFFEGRDITHLTMHERVACGLARSYQITNVFNAFPVLDNLALAVQARHGSSLRFWRAAASERALFEEAESIARQIGLGNRLSVLARNLSHGEQRKLELGLAMATRPKLLLLDEPMAGMGHDESDELVPLIEAMRPSLAVLLVEHDMDTVFRIADRISVLVSGKIIASGAPEDIRGNADVRRAYLGDEVPA